MRHKKKLLTAAMAMAMGMGFSHAQSMMAIHWYDSGRETVENQLTTATKITFSEKSFSVDINGSGSVEEYAYGDVEKISFSTPNYVNAATMKVSELSLKENPVGATLVLTGYNDTQEYTLGVYSMSGQQVTLRHQWKGEDIDVSSLPSGVYLLKINTQTFKFIKK